MCIGHLYNTWRKRMRSGYRATFSCRTPRWCLCLALSTAIQPSRSTAVETLIWPLRWPPACRWALAGGKRVSRQCGLDMVDNRIDSIAHWNWNESGNRSLIVWNAKIRLRRGGERDQMISQKHSGWVRVLRCARRTSFGVRTQQQKGKREKTKTQQQKKNPH